MVKSLKYRPTERYWEKDDIDEEPEAKRARKYGPFAVKKSTLVASFSRCGPVRPENKLLPRSRKTGGRHKPIRVTEIFGVSDGPKTPRLPAQKERRSSAGQPKPEVGPETETEKLINALKHRLKDGTDDWAEKHERLSACQPATPPSSPRLPSQLSRLFQKLEQAEKILKAREAAIGTPGTAPAGSVAANKLCTPSPASSSCLSDPPSGTTLGIATPEGDTTLLDNSASPNNSKLGKSAESPVSSPCAGKSKGKTDAATGVLHVFSRARGASVASMGPQERALLSASVSFGNISSTRVSARRPILAPKTVNVPIPLPCKPQSPTVEKIDKPILPPPPKRGSGTSYRAQKEHKPVYMMYPQAYLQQATCSPPLQTCQRSPPRRRSTSVISACHRPEPDSQFPGGYPLDEGEAQDPIPSSSRSVAAQVFKLVFGMLQLVFLKSWQAVWRLTFSART
ncbi:hypothetical protein NEOLEDRAFT_1237882 [Neolentinus lepideus HHB14362 ss-1]|uniref:Uncharacterized protein n=1 Tax=Neolentinus lepideus HHB14362 ss-1 TaxID=1314782 RepID=A0A165W4P7_9AGAM|nr:hypothetical protein NEOLEDRAFT_1237882 [Neolentinus lepideus HHB14362 ss-1]